MFRKKEKYTDPILSTYLEEFNFILPKISYLFKKILIRGIWVLFKYKWKKLLFWLCIISTFSFLSYELYTVVQPIIVIKRETTQAKLIAKQTSQIKINSIIDQRIIKYFDAIASTEADERGYQTVNSQSDAWGRYQLLNVARLQLSKMGVTFTKEFFLSHPEFQDIIMYIYLKDNYNQLIQLGLHDKYNGVIINGYYLTNTGLLSLSHAIGPTGVKQFVDSGCDPSLLPYTKLDRRLTIQKFEINF